MLPRPTPNLFGFGTFYRQETVHYFTVRKQNEKIHRSLCSKSMFLILPHPFTDIVTPLIYLVNPFGRLETTAVHHAYFCGSRFFSFMAPVWWHTQFICLLQQHMKPPMPHVESGVFQYSVSLTSRGQDSHSELRTRLWTPLLKLHFLA